MVIRNEYQDLYAPAPQQQQQQYLSSTTNNNTMYNNNNINTSDVTTNNIQKFYKNCNVFITGATGFVGKALVEKLLRSCDEIAAIYLLVRPKRGMEITQRLKELLANPAFNRIRDKSPESFAKVKVIAGDVSQPNLGLSDQDREFLYDNINIVLHSAATVKFNEDLRNAVILNTIGTKQVVNLCEKMRNLKSFVHVSTAYSNPDKRIVDEQVYQPPHDPNEIMKNITIMSQDEINSLSKRILGKHPNTYTLTKAMAEHIVLECSSTIPAAIVRPSIITAAWKEPYPGWVDNVSGITGIFMECGRGTIKSIICDQKCRMDLIPVDVVVNTIITAAWHTATHRSNTMRVYNCTSGNMNPITWKEFGELTHRFSLEYPTKYVMLYPGFTYRTNRVMHLICATLFHMLPAAFVDLFLYCMRQKTMMLRISLKFYNALDAGKFFSTNEWDFRTATMDSLIKAVAHAENGDQFALDMRGDDFDWTLYVKQFILGVRKYVLKDDISTLPMAKVRLNRLYWVQKALQVFSAYAVIKMIAAR